MKWLCCCLGCLASILLAGCISRPSLTRQLFAFETPASSAGTSSNGPSIGLRPIFVAPPFASQSLTYRTAEFSFERDPYAGFIVPPAQSVAEPLRAYLRNSGAFSTVTEPESGITPDLELAVSVTELYGDFSDRSHPFAVLQLRFVLYNSASKRKAEPFLNKEYSRRLAIPQRTATALVAGWNEALKQIAAEAATDLKSSLK